MAEQANRIAKIDWKSLETGLLILRPSANTQSVRPADEFKRELVFALRYLRFYTPEFGCAYLICVARRGAEG
jgi:hypothetical protein